MLVDCFAGCRIEHFSELGATLYRGPMLIENALAMCQVKDPFGNLIGLRGEYSGCHTTSTDV